MIAPDSLITYPHPDFGLVTGRVILLGTDKGEPAALCQDLSPNGAREWWPVADLTPVPAPFSGRTLPASFALPLVRRVRAREKTETRRPTGIYWDTSRYWGRYDCWTFPRAGRPFLGFSESNRGQELVAPHGPYGRVGDRLYVRETALVVGSISSLHSPRIRVRYLADDVEADVPLPERIRLPMVGHCLPNGAYREACRTWLEVTAVRVERLQDITPEGAVREGFHWTPGQPWSAEPARGLTDAYRAQFARAWDGFYTGPKSWDANPWVWAYAFNLMDAAAVVAMGGAR